jgi:1-acyl-sn-glycerol-3-phosphate acyltransferase
MFKLIYKLFGWKVLHYLPDDVKQCVIVAAPHTSNWDFVMGMGALRNMKIQIRFVIKKEWMRFPFKRLMKSCGALPIERSITHTEADKKGTVRAMADLFKQHETLRLLITPEGTRSRREKWRTGFYYVALEAKVPIALGYMDYARRECGIDKIIYPTGDFKKDMKEIMDFYKDRKGKNLENFSVDVELR